MNCVNEVFIPQTLRICQILRILLVSNEYRACENPEAPECDKPALSEQNNHSEVYYDKGLKSGTKRLILIIRSSLSFSKN